MLKILSAILFFTISVFFTDGLSCYSCQSSNENECKEIDPKKEMTELCGPDETYCLSFGVKSPTNKEKPTTFIRKCTTSKSVCGDIDDIHKDHVIECTACGIDKCNKLEIGPALKKKS